MKCKVHRIIPDEYKLKSETEIKRAKLNAAKAPSGGSGGEESQAGETAQSTGEGGGDNATTNAKILVTLLNFENALINNAAIKGTITISGISSFIVFLLF
jgi:hypothetical protein